MPNRKIAIALGLLGATMLSTPAGAQGAAAPETAANNATPSAEAAISIETVTVTARRRAEDLERVPVAVTAISSDDIRQVNLRNAIDLQQLSPSLTVSASLGSRDDNVLTIRGQSQPFGGADPGVQAYFSEIPFGASGPGNYFDMDNIQVLRGPQGTLFGRNTTGGAVLFEPKKPTDQFGGYADGQYGNLGMYELEGALNVPVLDDKLMIRLAGDTARRHGFTQDVSTNSDLDNVSYDAFRAAVTFKPFAGFENYTVFNYINNHDHGTGAQLTALADPNTLVNEYEPRIEPFIDAQVYAGALPGYTAGVTAAAEAQIAQQLEAAYGLDAATAAAMAAQQATNPPLSTQLAAQAQQLAQAYADASAPGIAATQIQGFYNGILKPALANQQSLGIRKTTSTIPLQYERHTWSIVDIASYEISDHLKLRNIFGYLSDKLRPAFDYDGSYLPLLEISNSRAWEQNPRQITEELQLLGDIGSWNYIIGYYHEHDYAGGYAEVERETLGGAGTDPLTNPFAPFASTEIDLLNNGGTSDAAYGSFTYDASDWVKGLSVTAGGRYTWDHKVQNSTVCTQASAAAGGVVTLAGVSTALTSCPLPLVASEIDAAAFHAPTWTIAVNYQITDDTLLYGTYRRGYKSGGFNGGVAGTGFSMFKPEFLTDVELGTKNNWTILGVPGRTNFDLYYGWYQDIQKNDLMEIEGGSATTRFGAMTVNAAKATIKGLEFESVFIPDENFEVSVFYSYTDASYDSFVLPQALVVGVGGVNPVDHAGDPFAYTPKHKAGITGRLHLPVDASWGLPYISATLYAQSKVWFSDLSDEEPDAYQAGYGLLNLRLDWNNIMGSPLDASAFANNVLDRDYKVGANAFEHLIGTTASIYGPPRMVGIELRVRFGADAQ